MFPAGLSPRVRGSQVVLAVWQAGEGSIPAGAGEPAEPTHARLASRVYPRGCGGATSVSIASAGLKGLSPRVRGSLGALADEHAHSGSIPAGAGEPRAALAARSWAASWAARVYPRGCGGARSC